MTHEGVEDMLKLWSPDGESVIMTTGETFKGLDGIRELATRSVAARTQGSTEGLLPFNTSALISHRHKLRPEIIVYNIAAYQCAETVGLK
jgi:hypothetical protein